jgi:hypothetical protein
VQEDGIATISISEIAAGCALHEEEAGMGESIRDLNDNVRHQLPLPA